MCLNAINAAGCTSKTCKEIFITVGISTIKPDFKLSIFPNPNQGSFSILFNNTYNALINIQIYNAIGSLIYNESINSSEAKSYNINTNLSSGIYLVKVNINQNSSCQKMIISTF